jgi:hypothetical protein
MKKIFQLVVTISFYATINAQDANYKGPAKSYVNSFWQMAKIAGELAEKGSVSATSRMDNMDKTIGIIKEKDPAYITSKMTEEVNRLRELLRLKAGTYQKEQQQIFAQKEKEQQDSKSREKLDWENQKKIAALLEYLFGRNNDNLDIEEMKAKTNELLALDRSGYTKFEIWIKRLKQKAEEAAIRYPKQEAICKQETRQVEAKKWYRVFQSYQSYWEAAQKIFPEEEGFKKIDSLITNILNGLGTEDNLLALVAKNYEQKVKNTRLPGAKVQDAALEKLFMDAYDKMYSESHKGKAIKAIIVSDDWQIQRNEITGVVTGRFRKGAIVYKNAEGQCRLVEEFFIQQEYVGNAFTGTKSVYAVGKGQEMLCENVK